MRIDRSHAQCQKLQGLRLGAKYVCVSIRFIPHCIRYARVRTQAMRSRAVRILLLSPMRDDYLRHEKISLKKCRGRSFVAADLTTEWPAWYEESQYFKG